MELMLLRPLWLLALLPWLWQGWRRRRQRPLLAPAMQAYLLPTRGRAIPWLWLATLPVILALAGPALRQQSQTVSSPALDIWLLDLSRSMLATDLLPDRATRVRVLLQDLLAAHDKPLLSTTLILPGSDTPLYEAEEIEAAMGKQLAAIVDAGPCPHMPTTVVNLTDMGEGGDGIVLRRGAGDPAILGL